MKELGCVIGTSGHDVFGNDERHVEIGALQVLKHVLHHRAALVIVKLLKHRHRARIREFDCCKQYPKLYSKSGMLPKELDNTQKQNPNANESEPKREIFRAQKKIQKERKRYFAKFL